MTTFIRLPFEADRESQLLDIIRDTQSNFRFEVDPKSFEKIPGAPFAYWVSEGMRDMFSMLPTYEDEVDERTVKQGLATADDFRFVRAFWEVQSSRIAVSVEDLNENRFWVAYPKGGEFSPFYSDIHLVVDWFKNGVKYWHNLSASGGVRSNIWMLNESARKYFFRPGLTYPRRLHKLAVMPMPSGSIISVRGSGIYAKREDLYIVAGLYSSAVFDFLVKCMLGRFGHPQFDNGTLCRTPVPTGFPNSARRLDGPTKEAIYLKRCLDTVNEQSHAFVLPAGLRDRVGDFEPAKILARLDELQSEIDDICFELYDVSPSDRQKIEDGFSASTEELDDALEDDDVEVADASVDVGTLSVLEGLLSWAVGVAFCRFDWRLATGERTVAPETDPFDPLPAKSPGMLPEGAAPFHNHSGILVDDQGHPHDLPRLIEEVLARVQADVPGDVRRWLQRDFFPFHLKQYSKSRRKAPIYWPLSTNSGSYTLWLYYPELTSQTLYSAVNDFVDPKLKQVSRDATTLREKGATRSRDDEKAFEALQTLELELIELRDTLLHIAPTYRPNHDDGVQITAAPLWQLFRHKPWQKILKDTWTKLEKGEYDWAHLAMAYWPDRVREKCKTDNSLAIAHDLEALYIEPEPRSPKSGKLKKDAE